MKRFSYFEHFRQLLSKRNAMKNKSENERNSSPVYFALPFVLAAEIVYLFVNYTLYLKSSPYHTSPLFSIIIVVLILLPLYIISGEKNKKLTKTDKLMIRVLIDFLIATRKVSEDEPEKLSEIIFSFFVRCKESEITQFVHTQNTRQPEDIYRLMAKKDVFFRNLLLKNLFLCARISGRISIDHENILFETAKKINIGKAGFNKRKFLCEKAGIRFESSERKRRKIENETPENKIDEKYALSLLGLSHKATDLEIKNARRHLAKKYHPDKFPEFSEEAAKKYLEITQAYEILKKIRNFK